MVTEVTPIWAIAQWAVKRRLKKSAKRFISAPHAFLSDQQCTLNQVVVKREPVDKPVLVPYWDDG